MKITRLCAANIREALRQVREQLGSEAVILSNKRVGNGIEIIAAVDYDDKLLAQEQQSNVPPAPTAKASAVTQAATSPASNPLVTDALKAAAGSADARAVESKSAPVDVKPDVKPHIVWSQDPLLTDMQHELKAIHGLLKQQLSGLAWGEVARRQPRRADLLERLLSFGLKSALCLRLTDAVAADSDPEQAWRKALQILASGLSVNDDDILTHGGVVALIGPTGVGKTTTVAKLAARYALHHGPGQVALITTDGYRIGAFDQLHTFGMILDMPVRMASNHEALQSAIADFADRSLILIDTAGMSQRDVRLSQQFSLIGATPQVKRYLVLAANADTHALEEAVSAFNQVPLAGCIITKLDEANRLGGALSVIHDRGLSLAYVSDGQRVPEDLQSAQIEPLLRMGEALMAASSRVNEDETLALAFGKGVINACF